MTCGKPIGKYAVGHVQRIDGVLRRVWNHPGCAPAVTRD